MKRHNLFCMLFLLILCASPVFAEDVKISTYYPSPYGIYKHLEIQESSDPSLTAFTQSLINDGINIKSTYMPGNYLPGLFWSTSNDNELMPKAGIWAYQDAQGSRLHLGTSNSYAAGITNTGLTLDRMGQLGIGNAAPAHTMDVWAPSSSVEIKSTTMGNSAVLTALNDAGAAKIGVEGGVGGTLFAGTTAYASVFGTDLLKPLHFASHGTTRMTIGMTGNVGIGTTNPNKALHIHKDSSYGCGIQLSNADTGSITNTGLNILLSGAPQLDGEIFISHGRRLKLSGGYVILQQNGGNVGIGTDSPTQMLQVHKNSTFGASMIFSNADTGVSGGGLTVGLSGDEHGYITHTTPSGLGKRNMIMTSNSGDILLQHTGFYRSGGNVGIGMKDPAYWLQLGADSAAKPNGGSWSNFSDARLKKNILPVTGAADKLALLKPVYFEWIHPDEHGGSADVQGGFLAQDVEKVFPGWVQEVNAQGRDASLIKGKKKIKSLTLPFEYDAIVVAALQEQIALTRAQANDIDGLREDQKKLRLENEALKKRLRLIENKLNNDI